MVTAITWNAKNGTSLEGNFAAGIEYVATITLAATANYKFTAITPVVNAGTPGLGVTSADAAVLKFEVRFPATQAEQSYVPPANNNSTTVKNEDGSTTTTVTDKKTGTVTETTKYPDGAKTVIQTQKDGSMVATATGADGTKVESKTTAESKTSAVVTTPEGKERVTVIIPTPKQPASGEVAVIVHEDGTREIVMTSVATEKGLKVTLSESATLEIVDNSKTFTDLPTSHWASSAIDFVSSRELFQGVGEGVFAPTASMTRAMLATVLYRPAGKPERGDAENAFQDVPEKSWYTDAVVWANSEGIMTGTGVGFDPDSEITRESLAVTLYRYAGNSGMDCSTESLEKKEFSDSASISDWAQEAMDWATAEGILTGKSNGKGDPSGIATRAEVATMLMRFMSLM